MSDIDGATGTIAYQWQRDPGDGFADITGATSSTYTLDDPDVGATIRVLASYTDDQGFAESLTSSATSAVENINDAPVLDSSLDPVLTAIDEDATGQLRRQLYPATFPGSVLVVTGRRSAGRLSRWPRRATIVLLVAEAIAFAHERGVIHRDLKPANVLLARPDDATRAVHLTAEAGRVIRSGVYQPKVTDFGLAKPTEAGEKGLTCTGQILGTPSYMPPEQASGRTLEVSAVSDVYSLGAILYATLTGHPPIQSDSAVNIVMQVLEREPVPPRQLNPAIPRDLETICLKCLEKDRRKRYATARDLIAELQRFLSGEPIQARRISGVERTWRWCRRKPALAGFWALCAVLLLVASIGGPLFAVHEQRIAQEQTALRAVADAAKAQATNEKDEAERQRTAAQEERAAAQAERAAAQEEKRRAQHNLVASQFLLGKIARSKGDTAEALSWYLQAYLNAPEGDRFRGSARNLIGGLLLDENGALPTSQGPPGSQPATSRSREGTSQRVRACARGAGKRHPSKSFRKAFATEARRFGRANLSERRGRRSKRDNIGKADLRTLGQAVPATAAEQWLAKPQLRQLDAATHFRYAAYTSSPRLLTRTGTVVQRPKNCGPATKTRYWVSQFGLTWRWHAAHALRDGGPLAMTCDADVVRQSRYQQLLRIHPTAAKHRYPLDHAAGELQRQPWLTERLQLYCLARHQPADIASRTSLPTEQIKVWQRLYFDHSAGGTDWLQAVLFAPTSQIDPLLGVKMRLARFGGPVVLDEIFAAEAEFSLDPVAQLARIRLRFGLQWEAAWDHVDIVRDGGDKVFSVALRNWLRVNRELEALQRAEATAARNASELSGQLETAVDTATRKQSTSASSPPVQAMVAAQPAVGVRQLRGGSATPTQPPPAVPPSESVPTVAGSLPTTQPRRPIRRRSA